MRATVTSKGQATLPRALREKLHLPAGDRIEFILEEDNSVRLVAKHASIGRLKRILPKPHRPVPLEEMTKAIEAGARDARDWS